MLALMELLVFTLVVIALAIAADRWGVDTREFEPFQRRRGADFPLTLI